MKHSFRDQLTPNADESLRSSNQELIAASREEALKNFNTRLEAVDGKIRSNAVLCVEYLITASPENMNGLSEKTQDKYFEDALGWLAEKHGKENIFCAGVHRDETTPHMYAYVVPISQENKQKTKLNAREFLGGKDKLSDMQTNFAEKVGQKYGFERGIKGSKAKHQTIKEFYRKVNSGLIEGDKYKKDRLTAYLEGRLNDIDVKSIDLTPKLLGYKEEDVKYSLGLLKVKKEVYEHPQVFQKRIIENLLPIAEAYQENERLKKEKDFVNSKGLDSAQISQINILAAELRVSNEKDNLELDKQREKDELERKEKLAEIQKMKQAKKRGFRL